MFKYTFNAGSQTSDSKNSASLALGGYYRFGDAVIPTLEVQWSSFSIGFSYDVNLSHLTAASSGQGGFEVGLKYVSLGSPNGKKSRASYF